MNNNNLKIKETFASALQNHQRKNFKVAENLYKEILKTKPNHFESVFYLGSLAVQTKNFDRAKQLFQKTNKKFTSIVVALKNMCAPEADNRVNVLRENTAVFLKD